MCTIFSEREYVLSHCYKSLSFICYCDCLILSPPGGGLGLCVTLPANPTRSKVLFASFFQGTFGLGMKFIKPLAWEAWWLVHVFIAMILFPMIWAFIAVPDLLSVIA